MNWTSCRCIARLSLLILIVSSSCFILSALISTTTDAKPCWLGTNCLLFGSVAKNISACGQSQLYMARGGNDGACHYSIFFSTAQLVVGVTMFLLTLFRRRSGHVKSRCLNLLEVTIIVGAIFASLVAAITISAGLGIFCNSLTKGFRPEPSLLVHSPKVAHRTSCSSVYVAQNVRVSFNETGDGKYLSTFDKFFFYKPLNIAQIAGWLSLAFWLLYAVTSVFEMREEDSDKTAHCSGGYRQLHSPASARGLLQTT